MRNERESTYHKDEKQNYGALMPYRSKFKEKKKKTRMTTSISSEALLPFVA